jgi:hypothetical protein
MRQHPFCGGNAVRMLKSAFSLFFGTENRGTLFFIGPADKKSFAASAPQIAAAFLMTIALRLCL